MSENRQSKWRKPLMGLLGIAMSCGGLAYVFRDIVFGDTSAKEKLAELVASVDRISVLPLVGSVVLYWAGLVVLRSLLVKHLLEKVGHLRVFQAYRYICIGFLANNVLPLRAGEVARSVAIHKGGGLSLSSVVGGLALERILDMAVLALVAMAAIQVAPLPSTVRTGAVALGGLMLAALVVLVIVARRSRAESAPDPDRRLKTFLWNLWVRFSAGFSAMGSPTGAIYALVLAVLIWAVALGVMVLRLDAFDLPATLPYALVLLTSLGFGVAVPSAPGYLGVYHAAVMFAMEAFGVDPTVAVAFAWFSWILDIGMSSLMGAVGLSVEGLKLGDLKAQKPSAEPTD